VVVRIAEAPVTNTAQLLAAVAALKPRSEADVGVQRGDQSLQLKLVIAQRPTPRQRELE
jgi:serine protease DegQ